MCSLSVRMVHTRSIEFMQGGHCTCLPKAVEVSGVYLHNYTTCNSCGEGFRSFLCRSYTANVRQHYAQGCGFLDCQTAAAIH